MKIVGKRTETYTVVPQRNGKLIFPEAGIDWWNTRRGRAEKAIFPGRVLDVGGSPGKARDGQAEGDNALMEFWLPLVGGLALAYVFGFWIGTGKATNVRRRIWWPRPALLRPALHTAGGVAVSLARIATPAGWRRWTATAWQRIADGFHARKERYAEGAIRAVPGPLKNYWCMRCISSSSDVRGLCSILQFYACRHLGLPKNQPMTVIGNRMVGAAAGNGDYAEMQDLMRNLEGARYGGPRVDLDDWKRSFRTIFRRMRIGRRSPYGSHRGYGLPELNPKT